MKLIQINILTKINLNTGKHITSQINLNQIDHSIILYKKKIKILHIQHLIILTKQITYQVLKDIKINNY